jgi:two-component system sensor histidine kinase HydH
MYLDVVVREVDRLNRVVGDLVEFARPREPQREPHDLLQLVQHALTLVEADVRAKELDIVRDLDATLPPLAVDRDLLLQALLNLLLNAIEAMEPGGTLSVRLGRAPKGVELAIQDTGRGIPAEHLGRLFDPFFTTKRGGTGLGLAIAHSVIQAHDSEIVVESTPGRGTTMTIRLPMPTSADMAREGTDA